MPRVTPLLLLRTRGAASRLVAFRFGAGLLSQKKEAKRAIPLPQNRNANMNTTENNSLKPQMENIIKPVKFPSQPQEWKIVSLRECPTPENVQLCEEPDQAADYWKLHIPTHPYFNAECECCIVLILNTRHKIKGHYFVSVGTMDTILIHPREVFRLAIIASASAIVLMHNHPSGESSPSDADIKATRDIIRAGQLLKIEVLDHVVMGNGNHTSLRKLGHFTL